MKIYRKGREVFIEDGGQWYRTETDHWDLMVNRKGLHEKLSAELGRFERLTSPSFGPDDPLDAPAVGQEIWAAGVTYYRSREARMEESKDAGGGSFYDKVYHAERPELFFKAVPYRCSGHGGEVRIRRDSHWNVPEPELTLFLSSEGSIEGYTVGNDMSSRSIEGENPLYLPQAKSYDRSAALGPCLSLIPGGIDPQARISIRILRNGAEQFGNSIGIDQMKRTHEELAGFLFRECSFPNGVYLMTGTGIVPPDHFTLEPGDVTEIAIDGIGTLSNTVNHRS
jgi:2-dehydro-3-deoxy-D-arabinonate dehydratase